MPAAREAATPLASLRPRAAVAALLAIASMSFCYVTTESLPVGLLPVIAHSLRASLSAVGFLVTGYAVTVAIVSIPLTYLTRRVPRRFLMSVMLAAFVLTAWASAAAPDYWVLMAARISTSLSQAVFWSVAPAAVAGLFPPRARGRAISVLFAGNSLAVVAGVPAGTWLGQQAGWRVPFGVLGAVGILPLVTIAAVLPTAAPGASHAASGTAPDGGRYRVLVVTTAVVITGAFASYTYIVPFLIRVSGFPTHAISALLLLSGAVGTGGLFCASALVDRRPRTAVSVPIGLLAVALLGLYLSGTSRLAAAGLLALFGFALTWLAIALQNRVLQVAPGNSDIASAGNSAAFNIGIASGAFVGGLLLPAFGVRSTALAGGLLAMAGLAVALSEPLFASAGGGSRDVPGGGSR